MPGGATAPITSMGNALRFDTENSVVSSVGVQVDQPPPEPPLSGSTDPANTHASAATTASDANRFHSAGAGRTSALTGCVVPGPHRVDGRTFGTSPLGSSSSMP